MAVSHCRQLLSLISLDWFSFFFCYFDLRQLTAAAVAAITSKAQNNKKSRKRNVKFQQSTVLHPSVRPSVIGKRAMEKNSSQRTAAVRVVTLGPRKTAQNMKIVTDRSPLSRRRLRVSHRIAFVPCVTIAQLIC